MVKGTEEQKRYPACPVVVKLPGMAVHHPGDEAPPMRQGLEVQGSPARSVVPQVAASSFWITEHGEVARYGCPSPRRRSPAHEAGARGARQSGKKCGAPGCCQFFLDHRARYGFSCHKTCHELHLSWHCCLSGCPYGGTVPLAETPGGSEIPRLLEDFQITGSSWERRGLPCGRRGRASTCLDR
ncbi:uncharacterized protein [Odocoileus virginianus]|uniref:Uncharacterized protein isoform X3 n=1 Tax=Odocoileus virginianus TaxID=9874 RepID=A0ABM4J2B5_ODOVR